MKFTTNNIYETIPLDDRKTYEEIFWTGRTAGVFQLEKKWAGKMCARLKPENIHHIAALLSLLRPGCLNARDEKNISITDHYILRKNKEEEAISWHPSLDKMLSDTEQLMIYQEAMMAIARELADFSLLEVDKLRKCVSGDTMFVSKTRGWITIDRLLKEGYKNDLFLVMDENGKQQWKKIERIWQTKICNTGVVKTNSGFNVKATKFHQLLTSQGWKARSRLKPQKDVMVCTREIEYDGDDLISKDLAIVIVGIVAEGLFNNKNKEGGYGHFTNFDENVMNSYKESFKNVFGHYPPMNSCGRVARLHKQHIDFLLKYMDFGRSDRKKLPDIMMGMTKETTRVFLSHLLGHEAGVNKDGGQLEFSSKSNKLINQVKLLLLRFGIRSYIRERKVDGYNDTYYRLYINDVEDQKKLINENLHEFWADYKKQDLINNINRISQFTTDTVPHHIVIKMIDQYPQCICNNDGGSVYSQDLSITKFKRLAINTNDPYWINLSNGKHTYEILETERQEVKTIPVYDFTIADEDSPYIIANGMVIHNSAGKKNAEEMTNILKLFVEKATEKGIVTKEEAENIANNIKASARYIFNASHAYGYGIRTYTTAYLKANHVLPWFVAWLKGCNGEKESIVELVVDAKQFDINVIPPCIINSDIQFKILDKNTIIFGLSDISGIGETTTIHTKEQLSKLKLNGCSWYEFLVLNDLSPSVLKILIECGALRKISSDRKKMAFEVAQFSIVNEKEKLWVRENYHNHDNIIDLLTSAAKTKKEGGACHNKNRVSIINDVINVLKKPPMDLSDFEHEIIEKETELLGISLTYNNLDKYKNNTASTIEDFLEDRLDNHSLNFLVEIASLRYHTCKGGASAGQNMAFVTLKDKTGEVNAVIFPDTLKELTKDKTVYEGACVLVECARSTSKDEKYKKSLIINGAKRI